MTEVLFDRDGEVYLPTPASGSPWHPNMLHGGAVSGLFGFGVEQQATAWPDFRLGRLTMDLLRPVPRAALKLSSRLRRDGGRLKALDLALHHDGKLVASASAVLQKAHAITLPAHAPTPAVPPPGPDGLAETGIQAMLDAKGLKIPRGLHSRVQLRPVTPWNESGQGTSWLNLPVTIVAGTPLTPLVRATLLSDLSNGVAQLNLGNATGTINADINLNLFRYPDSEWLAIQAQTQLQPTGLGLVQGTLFDTRGAIGYVTQVVQSYGEFTG
ncbi:acyl-CoA thioesterase domain-containing protein [Isoalcanivorax indicus]|uniref:acyl-CoA thioesterase domain-containing protein n=1 Tax=Isoalcanivorax indicus TaxID=2202653 RepID=UPI0013C48D78|nr:acyl-CoA thioesterase domain-containing protein [Isoalcanivorax indicus]